MDGDALKAVLISGPAYGTLAFNDDGSLTYMPAKDFNGTDTFTYKANDVQADSNVATVTITVNRVNLPPVANAGSDQTMYSGDVLWLYGSAYDPDGEPIVAWSWVVESAPAGAEWTMAGAELPTLAFGARTPGQYIISLLVEDPSAGSVPDVITVTVADNLPPVAIATADKTEGPGPLTVQFDGSQSYDPEGRPLAELFWDFGDGSAGSYAAVPPPHTYVIPGNYNVVILAVTDERGAVGSDTIVITVTAPVNQPPVAAPGGPYVGVEGTPITLNGSASSDAEDAPGALTYAWDLDYDGITFTPDAEGVTPTVSFADNCAARTIALRVTDTSGAATIATTTLEVRNAAPTVAIATPAQTLYKCEATNLLARFSHAGAADTHTALIDWGDGTTSAGLIDAARGTVAGSHQYAVDGTFTVTVTVTDDDGGSGRAAVTMNVLDTGSAIEDLIGRIDVMNLGQGVESSLTAKLAAAAKLLGQNVTNDTPLLALLDAFAKGVDNWYSKGKLTLAQHDELIYRSDLIRVDILQT